MVSGQKSCDVQVKCFCQGFHLFLLLVYYIQNNATKHQIEQLFIHIQKHKFINEKVLQLYMKCRMKCRPAKTLGRIENSSHRICVQSTQTAVCSFTNSRILPDFACRIPDVAGYFKILPDIRRNRISGTSLPESSSISSVYVKFVHEE